MAERKETTLTYIKYLDKILKEFHLRILKINTLCLAELSTNKVKKPNL